jgi:hypothetical protein
MDSLNLVHSSAKTGENVGEAFTEMVKEILPDLSPPPIPPSEHLFIKKVKVHTGSTKDKKEKCVIS